jgi:hypothetical protein
MNELYLQDPAIFVAQILSVFSIGANHHAVRELLYPEDSTEHLTIHVWCPRQLYLIAGEIVALFALTGRRRLSVKMQMRFFVPRCSLLSSQRS